MMKREDAGAAAPGGGDDDFVTKTNKSSRKKNNSKAASAGDEAGGDASGSGAAAASGVSGAAPAASSEGISLRPRTMFTVKGRGRAPEADATPAYRPQWSKDGDGFVSNTPSASKDGDSGSSDASRRKGKVLRYSKDELLALHVEAETPPQFLVETAIASEISLPPVGTLPFDYEELYKQWALNKNRGRGRGRTTTGGTQGNNNEGGNSSSERSRSNGKWDETKWDKPKRGDDRHNGDDENSWGRGTNGGESSRRNHSGDIWDDVGVAGGDSMELDLSSMAAAAEKFRREMDAMRDEEHAKLGQAPVVDDMDAFDQKLEHAAAAGQFEDSDEEVGWDMPLETELSRPVEDSPLLFQSSHFDQKLAPSSDIQALRLDEPSFSLGSLSGNSFGMSGLSLEVEVVDEWFYLDPQGLQQGPFKTAEMREWFEAGYFKPNLPIRFGHEGAFTPLANNFLQGQLPFAAPPRPSPKINLVEDLRRREQQRLIELQQHQQQQQQMMQLQQQQEQQRMLQFNQEEKIRLEMQRLEMARQQQNHLFQQQQQLIHQQQQQQQQQQMLLQQQSSWQRSQREGIMSALGIFGGADSGLGGVKDHFQQQPMQYEPDFRNSRQLEMNDPARIHDPSFSHNPQRIDDPWGANQRTFVEPPSQPGFFTGSSTAVPQTHPHDHLQPETPKQQSETLEDPWKRLASNITEPGTGAQTTVEPAQVINEPTPTPVSPERIVEKKSSPVKEKSKVSPVKKQPRSGDASKQAGAWSTPSTSNAASTKSLKEIQADEQRELRQSLGQDDSNLEHMGAQLKMMLGVNATTGAPQQPVQAQPAPPAPSTAPNPKAAPLPTQTAAPTPAAPSPSPWGKAAPTLQQQQASKSMREILLEEERLAAERAKRAEAAPTSSHWMNVVAGNAAPPAAAPKVSRLGPVPASVLKSTTRQSRASASGVSGDAAAAAARKSVTTPSKVESDASFWNFGAAAASKTSDSPAASGASNFGAANIPSEFMGWCAKQVKSINGSDDLTLVEYCATLEDPGEIREYLAAYLGSTPRVSAFATEFIQRKKSMPTPSKKAAALDAAFGGDAADVGKKGKRRTKGQKIDPSLLNYSVGS